MKSLNPNPRSRIASIRLLAAWIAAASLVTTILLYADPPAWWATRGVTSGTTLSGTNDYAVANQGQVKNMATAAVAEFDLDLPGGAGQPLHLLISGWVSGTASANDYAAINLGQLKMVAQPFYDRLMSLGYATRYPWDGAPSPNDYAVANIGQVKNLFSFNFPMNPVASPGGAPVLTSDTTATGTEGQEFNYTITSTNSATTSGTSGYGSTTYSASGLPTGLTLDATTGVISGTMTSFGWYPVIIAASNNFGTTYDPIQLEVSGPLPAITSAATVSGGVGTRFTFQLTANNFPSGFGYTGTLPPGLSLNPGSGVISGTGTTSGTYTIAVTGTNTLMSNATGTLTIDMMPAGPSIIGTTTSIANIGEPYEYEILTHAFSGTYAATGLPAGLELDPATGQIIGIPTVPGSSTVTLEAIGTGTCSGSASATLNLRVANGGSTTPVITSASIIYGVKNLAFTGTVTAANYPTNFSASGLPSGLAINATTGVITGTVTSVGTHTANLTVTNSTGTATGQLLCVVEGTNAMVVSATCSFQAGVNPYLSYNSMSATIISNTADPTAADSVSSGIAVGDPSSGEIERGLVGFDVSMLPPDAIVTSASLSLNMLTVVGSSDVELFQDGTAFYPGAATWSANSGSEGLLLSTATVAGTGSQSWTSSSNFVTAIQGSLANRAVLDLELVDGTAEAQAVPGGATYAYTASDETDGALSNRPLLVITYKTACPPVVIPNLTYFAVEGTTFTYHVPILHNPSSISVSGLPTGLSFAPSTGMISGSTATGTYQVTVTGSNANGIGSGKVTLCVGDLPNITGTYSGGWQGYLSALPGSTGVPSSLTIGTSNGPATYTLEGSLPSGLTLNSQTGVISGTPDNPIGSWGATIDVQNAFGTVVVYVYGNIYLGTPQFSGTILSQASGNLNVPFNYNISSSVGSGINNDPTGYVLTGSLPGISIQSGTLLSGTPTMTGTFTGTLTGGNATGLGNSVALPIVIFPAPHPIVSAATLYTNAQVAIDGTSLQISTGSIGTASSYTYSVSSQGMPYSLDIDGSGNITGYAETTGTCQPTITITDSIGGTYNQTPLTIDVLPYPSAIETLPQYAVGNVGASFKYQTTCAIVDLAPGNALGTVPTVYQFSGLPPGLSGSSSGVLSGTPTVAGTYPVGFSATWRNIVGDGTLNVIVNGSNSPIFSPNSTNCYAAQGFAMQYPITFNIPNFTVGSGLVTISSATELPYGLYYADEQGGASQGSGSGSLWGVPTTSGTFGVIITATNSNGTSTENLFLTIAPSQTITGTAGAAFSGTIDPGDSTAYDFLATNLPIGLSLNPVLGIISGTPVAADLTGATINYTNQNGYNSSQLIVSINPASSDYSGSFQQGISPSASYNTPSATIVNGTDADTVYSTSGTQYVGHIASGTVSRALLAFDISSLPANATVTSANLMLNIPAGLSSGVPMLVEVHQAGSGFDPATATWNNNSFYLPTPLSFLIVNPATDSGTVAFHGSAAFANVLNQALASPTEIVYLSVQQTPVAESGTGVDFIGFTSGTSTPSQNPKLVVTYTSGPATAAPVITSATTVTGTINLPISYLITASNRPTSFSASSLPPGLSLNTTTSPGLISGTVSPSDSNPNPEGSYQATVSAINAIGTGSATVTFNIDSGTQITALTPVSGTNQFVVCGSYAPIPLAVHASSDTSGTLANTLVTFSAKPGTFIATSTAGPPCSVLSVPTGTNGNAAVYMMMPQNPGNTYVRTTAGVATPVVFQETAVASAQVTSTGTATAIGNDVPVLSIISGEDQTGTSAGQVLAPFVIQAVNHLGQPLGSLPLNLQVLPSGSCSISPDGTSWTTSLSLTTSASGTATVYMTTGSGPLNQVSCTGSNTSTGGKSTIYLTALTETVTANNVSAGGGNAGSVATDSDPSLLQSPTNVSVIESDTATSGTSGDPANWNPSIARICWSGASGTSFTIQEQDSSSGQWNTITTGASGTYYDQSGLLAETDYQFRVIAVSGSYSASPSQSAHYGFPLVQALYWKGAALQSGTSSTPVFGPYSNSVEYNSTISGSLPTDVQAALSNLGGSPIWFKPAEQQPAPSLYPKQNWQTVAGVRKADDHGSFSAALNGKYYFALNPCNTSGTLSWNEVFNSSNSSSGSYNPISDSNSDDFEDMQTGTYGIDTSNQVTAQTSGTYEISIADGLMVTNGGPGDSASGSYSLSGPYLDPTEKSGSGGIIITAGTAEGAAAELNLPQYSVSGSGSYSINITGSGGLSVIDETTGEILNDGSNDIADPTDTFYVYATSSSEFNVPTNVEFTVTGSDGKTVVFSGSSNFTYAPSTSSSQYEVPVDEASGPKYRKIAMNGMPLSDEKPQHSDETDQEKEESFVDALTLQLRHSTTDIYLPVAGSDFAVSARRDVRPEVWNMRSGVRPHEDPTKPFGICWSSNLAPNIHFITSDNPQQSEPDTAVVTDESGAAHPFIVWYQNPLTKSNPLYFPKPTSLNERTPNLETLTRSGGVYTFKKKYGSTLTFEMTSLVQTIGEDRLAGSLYHSINSYARLGQAVDRLGNTIKYTFAGATTLVPSTITVINQPDTKISIQQKTVATVLGSGSNNQLVVTSIWDANGNQTVFNYGVFNDGTNNTCQLQSVVSAANTSASGTTQYSYEMVTETDQTPVQPGTPQLTYYHAEIHSIEDPNEHAYGFNYNLDHSKLNYMNNPQVYVGYYVQSGLPRNIVSINLPAGYSSSFENKSKVYVSLDGTANPHAGGIRQSVVTDANGFKRTYNFNDPIVVPMPQIQKFYQSTNMSVPEVICYQTMKIGYGDKTNNTYMGSETFQYDIGAAMALSKITDFSGNSTTFVHGDSWADLNPFAYGLYSAFCGTQQYSALGGIQTAFNCRYDDPTEQIDALSGTQIFAYDILDSGSANPGGPRIMTDVTDQLGRHTHYSIDSRERRIKETVYTSGTANRVKVTDFAYGDPLHPGFMTQKTIEPITGSDPSWVQPLVTSYASDSDGRVKQETVDPNGLCLTTSYTYDANGNKLTATGPRGNTTSFRYDSRNRLTNVVYADGSAKSFTYDARGNKTEEVDENQNATLYTYDPLNRVTTKTRVMSSGSNLVTNYAYNPVNSGTSVQDPNGNITTMVFDKMQRLSSSTDARLFTTTYSYGTNSGGNPFDSSCFKPTEILDPRGYTTEIRYDQLYRTHIKSIAYQTAAPPAVTTTSYDAVGNPTSVVDPRSNVTTGSFDALNRPTVVTHPDGTSVHTVYTSTGFKCRVEDELWNSGTTNLHAADYQYDAAGRLAKTIGSQVSGADNSRPTTFNYYDGDGNLTATINPLGNEWDYIYDARNRRIQEFAPPVTDAPSGIVTRPVITTEYDAAGRVTAVIDAKGNETDKSYDNANRVTSVTEPQVAFGSGSSRPAIHTGYDNNGNILSGTDANGHVTANTYDAKNEMVTTTQYLATGVISGSYGYDQAGNRTTVIDGNNNSTTFVYDGLNRNTSVTDPLGNTTRHIFDGMGEIQRIDAAQQSTTYVYDNRNRLTNINYATTGTAINSPRIYGYDAVGNLTSVSESGKGGAADVAYTYDGLNRQITENSGGHTHNYTYDLANNRTQAVYGGTSLTLVSAYDALNRLSTMTESGANVTQYGFDLNGNCTSKTLPNLDVETASFDALNRMAIQTAVTASGTLYSYAYAYDLAGNVLGDTETYMTYPSGSVTRTVANTYDNVNRLSVEGDTISGTTTYTYDNGNNRLAKAVAGGANPGTTNYTYNAVNQLTGVSGAENETFTYDANGNRATVVGSGYMDVYVYDFENRLVGLSKGIGGTGITTGTYVYVYDYRTRRVLRNEAAASGSSTQVIFSGGVSVQEYDNSGATPTVQYVRGSDYGGGVGGVLYTLRDSTASYTHENRRGDVVAKTSATGSLTFQAAYQAYGQHPAALQSGATSDRQKANTKDEDPTGMTNEGHRYRDLDTGIFITKDPAGFVDGPNLYTYVRQNPWTSFDPEGLADSLNYEEVGVGGSVLGYPQDYSGQAKTLHLGYKKQSDPGIDKLRQVFQNSDKGDVILYNGHGGEVNGVPGITATGKADPSKGQIATGYVIPSVRQILTAIPKVIDATEYPISQMVQDLKQSKGVPAIVILDGCDISAKQMKALTDTGVSLVLFAGGTGSTEGAGKEAKAILDALAKGETIKQVLKETQVPIQEENEGLAAFGDHRDNSYSAAYGDGVSEQSTFDDIKKKNEEVNANRQASQSDTTNPQDTQKDSQDTRKEDNR